MNCQDFANIVNDLAAGRLMNASTREHGLAHAATCKRCAARMADEHVLNAGLSAFAESAETAAPSPQLKASLRAAFDARYGKATAPIGISTQANTHRWALAAVAAILLVAMTVPLWLRQFSSQKTQVVVKKLPTPSRITEIPEELTRPPAPPSVDQPKVVSHNPSPGAKRRIARRDNAPAVSTFAAETTTGFIPLTYLSSTTALQSGVIVRVEVERATLIAMGLPLNLERAGSRIKADLALGDDGVARAIRLVE